MAPPALPGFVATMTLSEAQASRRPDDAVRSCSAGSGLPSITRTTFPACRAHYPGGSNRCVSIGYWCAPAPGSSRFALAFPAHTTGRHPWRYVSRLAQASLTLRPAGLLAHLTWTLSRGSSPNGSPFEPLVSYPGISTPPGVGLSPTGNPRRRGARARHKCGGWAEDGPLLTRGVLQMPEFHIYVAHPNPAVETLMQYWILRRDIEYPH